MIVNNKIVKTFTHTIYCFPNKWTTWGAGVAYQKNWTTDISVVKSYIKNGVYHFNPEDIPHEIKGENDFSYAVHTLTQKFGIRLDSLTIEARLKNPESEGGESCFNQEISLTDKKDNAVDAVFTMVGCTDFARLIVGNSYLRFYTPEKNNEDNLDLDLFGVNHNEWNIFKIRLLGNVIEIFVNDKLVFKNIYSGQEKFSELEDLRFVFKGTGSIDWVKLSNSATDKVIYTTDFDE